MSVPLSLRMACGAFSSEAMTARLPQPLRTKWTAASTFGFMDPAANCPLCRYMSASPVDMVFSSRWSGLPKLMHT